MSLQILSFGSITDITGSSNFTMPLMPDTASLISTLKEKFPNLADKRFLLAVNAVTVSENTVLSDGDNVAILPPFSGG
jgi:molybdopterin converting factor small subunit